MQFLAIVLDSFRESRDRKIFWVMLGLSILVAAGMFCFRFEPGAVDVLFGTWRIETQWFTDATGLRSDRIATIMVDGVMDTTLGWVGMILAIVATAGFLPNFLERGVVDVVLSKPIARWKLFLAKYLGSMVFVLVQAAIFVVLTLAVARTRWGIWLPGYLLVIPLTVLLFSYMYCVSALVAVYYRSTLVSVLLSLAAWVVFFGVQSVDDFLEMGGWRAVMNPSAPVSENADRASSSDETVTRRTVRILRWAIPKTQDITYLARRWSRGANAVDLVPTSDAESEMVAQRAAMVEAKRLRIPAWQTIGSSLLFEAVLVVLAMWKFSTTDY